jgi:hypothetical protein
MWARHGRDAAMATGLVTRTQNCAPKNGFGAWWPNTCELIRANNKQA